MDCFSSHMWLQLNGTKQTPLHAVTHRGFSVDKEADGVQLLEMLLDFDVRIDSPDVSVPCLTFQSFEREVVTYLFTRGCFF